MTGEDVLLTGEKIDPILDGRLRIIQREKGYRFSLDALLLACFVAPRDSEAIIELGTGCGIISLILARHPECTRILGVEIQAQLVSVAARNVSLNKLDGIVNIARGDVRLPESCCLPQTFSVAVFNPPYRRQRSGRVNPEPEKAAARHELLGKLDDFIACAVYALRPGGRMSVIYPATRMTELIAKMRYRRVEPKRLRIVHSRSDSAAVFVLVEGVKGGGEGLEVMPPLFIYQEKGEYSPEMKEIFKYLSSFEASGDGLSP